MDAEISQSEHWLRFLAWLEQNWRRAATIGAIVIAAGIVVAYALWQGAEKERRASQDLSTLLVSREEATGSSLLDFANTHEGTAAGARAVLFAATALFAEGQYVEAQAQFERFLTSQGPGPDTSKAQLGIAACKAAQGQADAAITDYRAIVQNPTSGGVVPQARFALAELYLAQGQTNLARAEYEALAASPIRSLAGEAQVRLEELPAGPAKSELSIPTLAPVQGVTN